MFFGNDVALVIQLMSAYLRSIFRFGLIASNIVTNMQRLFGTPLSVCGQRCRALALVRQFSHRVRSCFSGLCAQAQVLDVLYLARSRKE